ncbi:MAG TPA: ArsI/CadI family heavy metal resistance metalloenzyme [Pirellulaceae bacterium]|nr:ArsI/CadI family heavy metal resistance metalloenzyme [Pirellulaceae bacterium]
MSSESAVQFATASRIHMGMAVQDLSQSVAFYSTLFGQPPSKTRPHYAKFEVAEPPVNLSLNEVGGQTGPINSVAHFGVQVKSTAAIEDVGRRLAAAGIATRVKEQVSCCYAVQNKIWATDPDGNPWEVYVVLDNDGATHASSQGACCGDKQEIVDALARGDGPAAVAAYRKNNAAAGCCTPQAAS